MLINILGVLIYYVNFLGIFDNFNKKIFINVFVGGYSIFCIDL